MSRLENKLTRREILQGTALLAAGAALAACQPTATTPAPSSAEQVSGASEATAATEATQPPAQEATGATGACAVTAPGTFPVVQEKATLTIFHPQFAQVENMDTNQLTVEYEEMTNVHIDWQLAPSEGLTEKRNLLLASGNYPDVLMNTSIPREDQMLYGSQGLFIPLNDLIEQYTVDVKRWIAEVPTLKNAITAPDGNIYALGADMRCFHCMFPQKVWINVKWLEKLGLEMPTTTDEFHQVLMAFKEKDPNGNGQADELPFMGAGTGTGSISGFVMCAFIYNDSGNRFILQEGTIDAVFNKPEWKAGLEYLNRLYRDGLIDSTAFTGTTADLKKLGEKEDAQVLGAVAALYPGTYQDLAGERHKDYDAVPPIKGPNGVQTCCWVPDQSWSGLYAITNACKCPELAIRWVDWFYTWEGGVRARIGAEGTEWRRAEPGELGLHGRQAKFIKTAPLGQLHNRNWASSTVGFDHSDQGACDEIYEGCGLERRLYEASELYEPYHPPEVVPALWFAKEDTARLAQLRTEINDHVNQSLAGFVTGELDLQKDWDTYVKQLEQIGLAEYLAINQKAYDAKYK